MASYKFCNGFDFGHLDFLSMWQFNISTIRGLESALEAAKALPTSERRDRCMCLGRKGER